MGFYESMSEHVRAVVVTQKHFDNALDILKQKPPGNREPLKRSSVNRIKMHMTYRTKSESIVKALLPGLGRKAELLKVILAFDEEEKENNQKRHADVESGTKEMKRQKKVRFVLFGRLEGTSEEKKVVWYDNELRQSFPGPSSYGATGEIRGLHSPWGKVIVSCFIHPFSSLKLFFFFFFFFFHSRNFHLLEQE